MAMDLDRLPSFDQLPVRPGAPRGSNWGLFGDDDDVGALNLITPDLVVQAARLVRKGAVFPLNLPLNLPDPPLFGRRPYQHRIINFSPIAKDDYLDGFWLQGSSQWDGLRHIRHPRDGFYNGVGDEEVRPGGGRLGIEHWARRGIVSRGVLLDVERYLQQQGRPLDYRASQLITREDLEGCARAQGVTLRRGDILLVRTGWLHWYRHELDAVGRERLARESATGEGSGPGLGPAVEIAAYLWDSGVVAIAADNPTVEAWPPTRERGFLHYYVIAYLGMPLGELWHLDDLAEDCARDGVYEFLLTSAPLNLTGGVGSPPNTLAIK